ncbi:zinc finger CCCH domain-containing protein 53-like [Andrographis paniculata]|uniref:zinc finger CCCH domain-containing protein 53-like n=1 Tax=Andrographis paniculata TaxID=175694 RepID=UPI0021E92186|nr:zinc finger CCCH domain-containing protein 53-like [Andrographis paniculata]XP_051124281.1 zinc finger CCCH domain-containing protein 53-like [Andrographis paniculata]XP_051124282.1 zinc finger CCCH domain-containing protein 53-like [Andrographis paniculata]
MDAYEATKIVFERIQNLDPNNASKIMGFLLIQDHGEKEMIRLAFGSDSALQAVILRLKKELGLPSPNTPLTPTPPSSISSPFANPNRRRSSSSSAPSRLNILTQSSNPASSWTNSAGDSTDFQTAEDLISPAAYSGASRHSPFYAKGEIDLIDELQLQDQLAFLNDGNSQVAGKTSDFNLYHRHQDLAASPTGNDAMFFPPYTAAGAGASHRRSCSVNEDDLSVGFGWKPCLFYARGYCKNGTTCRFLHGGGDLGGDGAVCNPNFSATKCVNLLQQLPSESPRSLMMDGIHKFSELGMNGMNSPGSRQIYLTFPADSSFKEEDVSHYFSNFGPVQDVRIPYQQKRMFGFVTFEYPETVKLILAKGNPHFVCEARVLVKPYKEKGKIPDKLRKQQQQMERGEFEFSRCGSPTGIETRDLYDLPVGAGMLYKTSEMLWRRKLEDEVDLQQAIALQNRRLMNLRLINIKRNSHQRALSTGAVISSPTSFSPTLNRNVAAFTAHGSSEVKENVLAAKDDDVSIEKENYSKDESKGSDSHERFEHNLPDSPFASPKALGSYDAAASAFFSGNVTEAEGGGDVEEVSTPSSTNNNFGPSLFPMTPSCFFQAPRLASGHETVGM